MKIHMFLLFLAKSQFDFDVEIQTPQFRQYETYRNSFAIWKKKIFKAPQIKGFLQRLKNL